MNIDQIRKYFDQIEKQSDEDWETFSSKLVRREFPKKTILLKTGQTENYLSFVEKGIIRLYIPKEDNELTFGFVFSNNFVSAYDSFLTQTPAIYQLQTLTETILWSLTYQGLQDIYAEKV